MASTEPPTEPPPKTAAELFTDIPEPRDTRERILFQALDLFHEHGFHAIGLDRILAAANVTKTTFYNHFESRDALILEAVRIRDQWDREAFRRRLQELAGFKPRDLLLGIFDVLDEWFTAPDFRGCLFVHACAEFPSPRSPVHRAAAGHFAVNEETVAQMADAAGIADPEAFARRWIVLMEGAIAHRMISGDDDAAKVARGIAERLLADALAA